MYDIEGFKDESGGLTNNGREWNAKKGLLIRVEDCPLGEENDFHSFWDKLIFLQNSHIFIDYVLHCTKDWKMKTIS